MRRKWIARFLHKRGLTIAPLNGPNLEAALLRLKARKVSLETIIDVGASNGCWTEKLLPYYPHARYLCIEAQPAHEPALQDFVKKHPAVEYALAAAGDREGEIYFDAGDLFGGLASEKPFAKNCLTVPVTTIDLQVEKRGLKGPFLIKLDTHGFELPILAGAARTLAQAAVLIVEVYNFDIAAQAVRFPEVCRILETKGFRCIDLFDPLYRPGDGAFWQMDLMFMRADRPELQNNTYV